MSQPLPYGSAAIPAGSSAMALLMAVTSPLSGAYAFKRQWGATPRPSVWQYHVRTGVVGELRSDSLRYRRLVRVWQRLPLRLTRLLGPRIVRGIP